FATFKLYRGSSSGFTPGLGNLVAATPDTVYVDPGTAGGYYKLSAGDFEGNESPYASLGAAQTTRVRGLVEVAFALDGVRPNPANGRHLMARFALPVTATAKLELEDVTGRRVVEREVGSLGAGAHVVDLTEGSRVRPGLYFLRLSQGA